MLLHPVGGVSAGSLASLNLGIHRGDQPERVLRNYEILGQAVGFAPEQTVFTRQTHTDIVARVGRETGGGSVPPGGAGTGRPCDG